MKTKLNFLLIIDTDIKMKHSSKTFYYYLDLIRWISAFLVVIGHIRSILFLDFSQIHDSNLAIKLFYFITGIGHEAVIIFFVLSGYLVGGQVIKNISNGEFIWIEYLIKRTSRLYIVLIPCLVFGFIIDSIGINYFNNLGSYTHSNIYNIASINYSILDRTNIPTFLANLFMLQTSFLETFGSNGPLWSLAYEFWYYILFPVIIYILKNNFMNVKKTFVYLTLILSLSFLLNEQIFLYMIIWIAGALISLITKSYFNTMISALLLLTYIFLSKYLNYDIGFYKDLLLCFFVCILINSFVDNKSKTYFQNINSKLADFSYTLYLFHFPFSLLVLSSMSLIKLEATSTTFIYFLLIIILVYIYSFIIYLFFENNTGVIRNYLLRKLSKKEIL
jgi:peptidoglycan/LPS O-acetylase OafA/YrhL